MRKYIDDSFRRFLHGADYNPEQWLPDKTVWDEDMRLFSLAGMNEMSVGIFAWSKLEPREGEYDFSWLDEVMDRISAQGGKVFLATPSGARPHWLADKYPDVLRVARDGVRNGFGQRHNHCPTSENYRRAVSNINEKLAERYARHPALLGWHISNEYNGEGCYCPSCRAAFRRFLEKKYGSVENLNHEWWTAFWSHTYDSFSQIDPPTPNGEEFAGLCLDWKRFTTEAVADFMRAEKTAIRKYSDAPVTTNFMTEYIGLNYNKMRDLCDVVSWDSYPTWHSNPSDGFSDAVDVAARTALCHDAYRALLDKPFVLMECTPSLTNWQSINKLKRPGMHKLSAMQAVAHGADAVQYFQFRKSRGANEQFHGAVVDHYGAENTRVFREVAGVGETLRRITEVVGSSADVKVALVMDVENDWALSLAQAYQKDDKKYFATCLSFYRALWKRGVNVDVVESHADLSRYKLAIAPMLFLTEPDTVENLTAFVKNGGTLISGYMLGTVGQNMLVHRDGFPTGTLKEVFGIRAEETDTLYPSDRNAVICGEKTYPVCDYCDLIEVSTAEVLGTYESDFYRGRAALTVNRYGDGTAYYLAARDTGELTDALVETVLKKLGIEGTLGGTSPLPYGVSAHERADGEDRYIFIGNYTSEEKTVDLGTAVPATDLETREPVTERKLTLPPFGCRILRKKD